MCQLLIDPKLRHALQTLGVVELRPHQLGAFISIDRGHDVLALLPTGSGECTAFPASRTAGSSRYAHAGHLSIACLAEWIK